MTNETCGNCRHEVGEHRNETFVELYDAEPCLIDDCDCPEFDGGGRLDPMSDPTFDPDHVTPGGSP